MTTAEPSTPPKIPDHEILKSIGRGSYGEVWLARNIFGTYRAIKTVRRESFSSARPYEREFAGIQKFEPVSRGQDGLVDVLQVGRNDAEGYFYYVMELADDAPRMAPGPRLAEDYIPWSLATRLDAEGAIPIQECVRLFYGLTVGLSHLHRAGLVHRDIKPSNIIFVNGTAKFADIGLVTSADASLSYVGTEGYIPPEGAGTVSADLFSLGKVLYEAATGKDRAEFPSLPIEGGSLKNEAELMELNAIWIKACAPLPGERYRTADELASDLALLQAGRSVKRLRGAERRFRQMMRFAVGVGLLALISSLFSLTERRRAESERSIRVQSDILRQRAEAAEQIARSRLEESRIAEARAVLKTKQLGRRAEVLSLLANVSNSRLRVQARSLAAAALVLPDLIHSDLPQFPHEGPRAEPEPDGTIRVKADPAGPVVQVVPSVGEPVRDPLVFSSNQRFLYAGYGRFVERVWDLTNMTVRATLDTNYFQLSFRPGRSEAAVAYVDGTVKLHSLLDWAVLGDWKTGPGESQVRWSPDGSHLLFCSDSGGAALLNPETGERRQLEGPPTSVRVTAWHPGASHVALAGGDGYIRVRSADGRNDFGTLSRHEALILDVLFLPPFPWLLSTSWDGTSRLWDWQAGCEIGRMESSAYGIRFDQQKGVVEWRFGTEQTARRSRLMGTDAHRQIVYGDPRAIGGPFMICWSSDSRLVGGTDQDGVRLWDVKDGTEKLLLPGSAEALWLSPGADEAFVNANGRIRHWQLNRDRQDQFNPQELDSVANSYVEGKLAGSRNGGLLAWIDGRTLMLRFPDRTESLVHGQELAEVVAVSPDGERVAVGTRNHIGMRVFAVREKKLLWKSDVRFGTHLDFSEDSRWLVVGTDSGCRVFDSVSGEMRWHRPPVEGTELAFWEATFSPDGRLVAWTPNSSLVQLLDARTGAEVFTLEYPTRRYITRLKFSPDGVWLAEASNKHTLHLWNIAELRRQLVELKLDWAD